MKKLMDNEKTLKKIRIIWILLMLVGGLMALGDGLSYLALKLIGYPYEMTSGGKFYLSPVYLALTGILLVISGFLIKSHKRIGLVITFISSGLTLILITLHSIWFSQGLGLIGLLGTVAFVLAFLIPITFMTIFLLKKEIKKNFT